MFGRMLALTALSLAGLAAAAPVELENRSQHCYKGVYMIVARGTSEAAGEGRCAEVVKKVQTFISDSGSVAVDYPATVVAPIYPISVSDGISDLISKVHAYVHACGSRSKIALIGYSQGAEVVTDALAGGVGKPDPLTSSYTKYLSAVTVFGDPTFTAHQSFDVGTAKSNGIFARGGSSLAKLNDYGIILQSYCNKGDEFCASGNTKGVHDVEVETWASAAAEFIVAFSNDQP